LLSYLLQPVAAEISVKWISLGIGLYAGMVGFTWLQMQFWIAPVWKIARRDEKMRWSAVAVVLGLLCFTLLTPANIQVLEKFSFLAPEERLVVRPLIASAREAVSIQRIKPNQRQVSSSSIHLEGIWQADGHLLRTDDSEALLTLTARVPHTVTIVFLRSPTAGKVEVTWAGRREMIDLRSDTPDEAVYSFEFDRTHPPAVTSLIRWLTLPAWLVTAFAVYAVFLLPVGRTL
jgi:hypothetical protein